MAILDGVPGLQVTIQSFDSDLPEYPDDNPWSYRKFSHLPHGMRSSTYVECVPDAEFRIRLLLKHPYRMTSENVTFKASVDGHGIAQASCNETIYEQSYKCYMELITSRLERISATELSSRTLKFSSIKKVDDADSHRVKSDAKLVAGMGDIVVSVFRTYQKEVFLPPAAGYNTNSHIPPSEVAEKALKGKAISCGVGYGEQKVVQRTAKEYVDIDGHSNPIGVFIFKYRSRKDLQSELIISRSPSPEPYQRNNQNHFNQRNHLPPDAPLSPQARIRHLKREIAELERVKQEPTAEGSGSSSAGQKRGSESQGSGSGRPLKVGRTSEGKECIDLTDD